MRRFDCHDRIKQVKSRYETAVCTVRVLTQLAEQQPAYLRDHELSLAEMRTVIVELSEVYFVRMFACFESCLRHYWRASVKRTKPLTEQLLSSIARRRGIPQDTLDAVHEIREYRNCLVHEENQAARQYAINEAFKHLQTYLARLPIEW